MLRLQAETQEGEAQMKKHDGDPPACVECEHYSGDGDGGPHCYSDDCSTFDAVLGRQPSTPQTARGRDGPCGLTGKFFSPKPAPLPRTWRERHAGPIVFGLVIVGIILWAFFGHT